MNRILCFLGAAIHLAICTASAHGQGDACASDLNGDGTVAGADLALVLGNWGRCATCEGDVNGDQLVDGVDLAFVLTRWGGTCAPTIEVVEPDHGPEAGGTQITVRGTHLLQAVSLLIGDVSATKIVVVDQNTVLATTPPGATGYSDVQIASRAGEAALPNGFRYGVIVPAWATLVEAAPSPQSVPSDSLREAIAETGLAWRVRDTLSQIEMLLVPPGQFVQGASPGDSEASSNESPAHPVTISGAFYLGKYEVTQSEYLARMGFNPSFWINSQGPVGRVSWNDAMNFVVPMSLRLPTEAEWEYACRAGTSESRYGVLDEIAWYYKNSGVMTHTVGTKLANPLGFHDMLGNAREWVYDWWGFYTGDPQTDPVHIGSESIHLVRGGSIAYGQDSAAACRASWRRDYVTTHSDGDVGFRVARNP